MEILVFFLGMFSLVDAMEVSRFQGKWIHQYLCGKLG